MLIVPNINPRLSVMENVNIFYGLLQSAHRSYYNLDELRQTAQKEQYKQYFYDVISKLENLLQNTNNVSLKTDVELVLNYWWDIHDGMFLTRIELHGGRKSRKSRKSLKKTRERARTRTRARR